MLQIRLSGQNCNNLSQKSASQSSDYFDDDPEFASALATLDESTLFGSQPLACVDNLANVSVDPDGEIATRTSSQDRKRRRSLSPTHDQENSQEEISVDLSGVEDFAPAFGMSTPSSTSRSIFPTAGNGIVQSPDTYHASKFGGLCDYKRRKRAKLQNQNAGLGSQDKRASQSLLFKPLAIYITGRTNPSLQVLRALILQHGGQYHAYLDRKDLVTHVVTSNLTPAKALEFKHMKVVRPEWLVDSAARNKLLPWSDYRWTQSANSPTQSLTPRTPALPSSILTPGTSLRTPAGDSPLESPSKPGSKNITQLPSLARGVTQRGDVELPSSQPPIPPIIVAPPPDPAAVILPEASPQSVPAPAPAESSRAAYAIHKANPEAERLMESAEWRETHTSASGEAFIQGYYQHSRLHHLSKWKSELRSLVAKAQEDAEAQISQTESLVARTASNANSRGKDKGKGRARERVIMHCDFDSFFVAAGLVARPELKEKPVVVCHASGKGTAHSTSEVASASYAARAFGVKNGMSLGQARKLCPEIQTIPYEFERYKDLSLKFYTILMSLADDLQAVSVDEALIDMSSAVENLRLQAIETGQMESELYEIRMAERIRDRVRTETGCEVSIGIGPNIMLARLATKRAKPAGSFYLSLDDAPAHIAELDIVNLHGFAGAVRDKALTSFGTSKLGDLSKYSKGILQQALGDKSGERIWNAIRGVDNRLLESDKPRKSVSADVNYGIRFDNNERAEQFIYGLAREVSERLKGIDKRGRTLTLKIMKRHPDAPREAPKFMGHGKCETFNKTCSITGTRGSATDDPDIIGCEAWKLLQSMRFDPTELRGIGIQIQKLEDTLKLPTSGGASNGQLARRFQQAVEKANDSKRKKITSGNAPGLGRAADVSIIDVDAFATPRPKPVPGHKEAPVDLTGQTQEASETAGSSPADRRFLPPPAPLFKVPSNVLSHAHRTNDTRAGRPNLPRPAAPLAPNVTIIDVDALDDNVVPQPTPGRKAAPFDLTDLSQLGEAAVTKMMQKGSHRARSLSVPRQDQPGANPKAGSLSPKRAPVRKRLTNMGPPTTVPDPSKYFPIFNRQFAPIPDQELVSLRIDPITYAKMPRDQQRALVTARRAAKGLDGAGRPILQRKRRFNEADDKPVHKVILAGKTQLPTLRAAAPGAPAVSTTSDVQDMIRKWVETKIAKRLGPDPREVAHFGGFLEKSMASDRGIERTVEVMRWWRQVCMRSWGADQERRGQYGREWWAAWWNTKDKLDLVIKKRFGGKLNLD